MSNQTIKRLGAMFYKQRVTLMLALSLLGSPVAATQCPTLGNDNQYHSVEEGLEWCSRDHGFNEGASCGLGALASAGISGLPTLAAQSVLGNIWDRTNMMGAAKEAFRLGKREEAIDASICCQSHNAHMWNCLALNRGAVAAWLGGGQLAAPAPTLSKTGIFASQPWQDAEAELSDLRDFSTIIEIDRTDDAPTGGTLFDGFKTAYMSRKPEAGGMWTADGGGPYHVGWLVNVKRAGRYELMVKYASAESRPTEVRLGDQTVRTALSGTTGGWTNARWFSEGIVELREGLNHLWFHREAPPPNIDAIVLIKCEPGECL